MKKQLFLTFFLFITTMITACDNSDDNGVILNHPNYNQHGETFTNVPDPQITCGRHRELRHPMGATHSIPTTHLKERKTPPRIRRPKISQARKRIGKGQ